ncbi:hypothetical protein OAF65_03960 [Verrucomicrobiales bacterium]|nr:hypothetical protein [Verrucomicrobiales bacterium]
METHIKDTSDEKPVLEFEEWGIKTPAEQFREDDVASYEEALQQCPSTGNGVHRWILKVTNLAVFAKVIFKEAYPQILDAMKRCGRSEQYGEIQSAYRGAERIILGGIDITPSDKQPQWHPHDIEKSEHLISEFDHELLKIGGSLYNDPGSFSSDSGATKKLMENVFKGYGGAGAVLRTLYPDGDPLICCGRSMSNFITQPLSEYRNLSGYQLIVPNPMTKRLGVKATYANTPEEELPKEAYSAHTKDNTGERHYQIIEFDNADMSYQARACSYLRKFLPLVMIVFSGNKSLHLWFNVKKQDPQYVEDFFNLASCLGADQAMWNRWQFARMPMVLRDDHKARGVEQKVHFLASEEDQRTCPISEGIEFPMPILRQD